MAVKERGIDKVSRSSFIPKSTIYRLMNNTKNIGLDNFLKVCEYFDKRPAYFLIGFIPDPDNEDYPDIDLVESYIKEDASIEELIEIRDWTIKQLKIRNQSDYTIFEKSSILDEFHWKIYQKLYDKYSQPFDLEDILEQKSIL